ncbi:MAG: DUF58 domain-containing protein [Propionibacteriaceae bacterium]|jgi:uncharacterized protein (DUF58 family)|nr:DUF58 domain-containing protein [Propionibacteriaceae bacterium]
MPKPSDVLGRFSLAWMQASRRVSAWWYRRSFAKPVSAWVGAVTGNGWALVVVILGCLGLIWAGGWIEAGVIAVICAVCLVTGLVSVIGRSWYSVQVSLPQSRTTVGNTAIGELRVQNTRNIGIRSGVVELPAALPDGDSTAQFIVPPLPGREQWAEVFAVPTKRRGVIVLGPVRSVRSDGLGLVRKIHQWNDPVKLYVNPKTMRVPFDATGFQSDVEGVTTAKLSSSDVSFHALRDYAPGDDRRFVHWPTTARKGKLVVRQFEETRRSHHLILLDSSARSWDGEDFEIAVSVAASLARAGLTKGRKVSLATSSKWISTTSAAKMLDELTELRLDSAAGKLTERVRAVLAARPAASVLTVVTGVKWPIREFGHWAVLAGPELTTGIVSVCPGQTPKRRTVGRALVADCPTLEDLPRVLQQRVPA